MVTFFYGASAPFSIMKILFYISCVYISFSVFRIIFDWHTSPYWVIPSLIAVVIQYKYHTQKADEIDIIDHLVE